MSRIVIINDISQPKGGATALALLSAQELRKRGHQVTFLAGDGADNADLRAAGIAQAGSGQQRLEDRGVLAASTSGLWNRAAVAMVRHWISANDTPQTVYHLHGWSQIFSPAVFSALKPVRDRLVLSAHDFFLACPNGGFANLRTGEVCPLRPLSVACVATNCDRRNRAHKLWRVVRQALLHTAFDKADPPPILMIHAAMAGFFVRSGMPARALHPLPNPIIPYSQDRIHAEDNKGALFVGRLEETKGPDLACAAARAAGVGLTVIGDGVMGARLRSEYPEVVFTGRLGLADIARHARQARMLVMPSRYPEPYGLVAMEAAWSGLPVVTAETALIAPDLVAAGAGMAVNPRDTAGFARSLSTLAQDDELARAQSLAAFDRTRHLGLTVDAWIDGLEGHYARRSAPLAAAGV